ncbi:helix-turn-helix domain-containing protein [Dinghuibacter silviterrae]|uniref:AraC-like DNA-binding protein n=1 Tax=Dinghuibacter silviterrae TaxID=1539049 RepID=A0A4R8DN22_9BACT|nr:AraC family transcriptional regulator [Dinghuibacter silviterrae]TDW99419.1 AraC-like DNA-binding protein [Dinghuibacter silviterrae]
MLQPPDILTIARKQPVLQDTLDLLHQKEQHIPGAVAYVIQRYALQPQWSVDDTGMMVYQHARSDESYLELRFCLSGNTYCSDPACNGGQTCRKSSAQCGAKTPTIDLLTFRFSTTYLAPFVKGRQTLSRTEDVLSFRYPSSFTKIVPLCGRSRLVLESLLTNQYEGALENIFVNSQVQALLLYSLECLLEEKEEGVFACKFLANEADRVKIGRAREILLEQIGEPITIKELSRRVAMNECYLKKGFKELFGTTIFDFYQGQRMEHARYLLYEKGLSVTEVSMMLGYSSISHFSTAFKKHTGLKPCDLLLH